MTMRTLRCLTVAGLAVVAAVPQSAAARAWSRTAILIPACGETGDVCVEPAPRAAVNARGQTVIAWVDRQTGVMVASAGPDGRFEKPIVLGKGRQPSVAITTGGTQVVVWSNRGGLYVVRRTPRHRFSRPALLVARERVPRLGDDSPKLAAQPDGSTVAIYESSDHNRSGPILRVLRTVRLRADGRPGTPRTLGAGHLGRDSFRSAPTGQVAVCCLLNPAASPPPPSWIVPRGTIFASYVPGAGWSIVTPPVAADVTIETVAPGGGGVALGAITGTTGRVGTTFGTPVSMRMTAAGAFAAAQAAPVVVARRAFGPVIAIDGAGRDVLVYQEKDHSSPFSVAAPIYGAVAGPGAPFASRRLLAPGNALQPLVRRYRGGAIVAWQDDASRWGVAIERDGRFSPAPAPEGRGPSVARQGFDYNRDIATNGRYVVLCWTALDGSIRASVGRL